MKLLGVFVSVLLFNVARSSEQCNKLQLCAPVASLPGQEPYLEGLRGLPGPPGPPPPPELEIEVYELRDKVKLLTNPRKQVCPSVTFHFPRKNQINDYVWYRRHVPSLKAATACAWVNVTDISHHISIASYAASDVKNNDFLIFFTDINTLRLHVPGNTQDTDAPLQLNTMTHLCVMFSPTHKAAYVNGVLSDSIAVATNPTTGGGSLILGQEQDEVNAGSLDALQSFSGSIGNYMMWPRVLSPSEILEIYTSCICPSDYVVSMTMDRVELFGAVSYEVPKSCPVSP